MTGGAGFIGSHLVDRLLGLKAKVLVYDNFDEFYRGKEENVKRHAGTDNFQLIRGDILDQQQITSSVSSAEFVVHEAAQPGIRYCSDHPRKAHEVNVTGTFNVLEAAKKARIRRTVVASSSSVFGLPRYVPMDEDHPLNPESTYGASKLASEKYCKAFSKTYGMDVVSLRYFSVYGPRGRPDQVIYKFAESLRKGKPPVIYGDGGQTRDFTYVADIVDATIKALLVPEAAGGTFNIGYGAETSVNELFSMLAQRMGKGSIEPVYKPGFAGEFLRTIADNAKAKSLLGWNPHFSLKEGLEEFLEWFNNSDDREV